MNPVAESGEDHGVKTYELQTEVRIPGTLDRVFSFFADAGNLELLTPPWLSFRILTPRPIAMRVGVLIDYRISMRGLPMRWRSEITAWEPPYRFVDEQRRGPYRLWVHEHSFRQDGSVVVVGDHVRYAVPGGPGLERLVHAALVRPDLHRIFRYRVDAMNRLLPAAA
ncbi:MAG: SRPBCC family protein [Phycisphaeraceae bacterium]|nr:SRPBCC family protein [Phycisphaeraceae bacterium]